MVACFGVECVFSVREGTMLNPLVFFTLLYLSTNIHAVLPRCSAEEFSVLQVTAPVEHGEGPHWDHREQSLYFVDISNQTVNRYNPLDHSLHTIHIEGGPVSPVIPTRKKNWFVVGRGRDLVSFSWDGKFSRGRLNILTTVDKDRPQNRFNDGKADASGRLWIGTMGSEVPTLQKYQGSLFSFTSSNHFAPIKHISGVSVSNGMGWNSNDTLMYYIDSPTKYIEVFDFDLQRGVLRNRREVFSLREHRIPGVPDGMTIDMNDQLWVAVYNGGRVLHIDPATGTLLKSIPIPATHVTSCAFGGPGLNVLYVTTSRRGLTDDQLKKEPQAGSVFAIYGLGVKGQRKSNSAKIN